jgi:hypothetical protein
MEFSDAAGRQVNDGLFLLGRQELSKLPSTAPLARASLFKQGKGSVRYAGKGVH